MSTQAKRTRLRSFADDLRTRTGADLARIIRARPDITDPVPADLAELASQASANASVRRVLEQLDRPALTVLGALVQRSQPCDPGDLPVRAEDTRQLHAIVKQLWELGMLWGPRPYSGSGQGEQLHVVTSARELLGAHFDAVGMPATDQPLDLAARDFHTEALSLPQTLTGQSGQHALAAITTITTLLELWSTKPPKSLRAGGLAVKDLLATAEQLGVDELAAGFWVELAVEADLLAGDGDNQVHYMPTVGYDVWRELDPARQWPRIAGAWLGQRRNIALLAATTGERLSVLGDVPKHDWLPELRLATLTVLSDAPPSHGAQVGEVVDQLADHRPLVRRERLANVVPTTLHQAELLGICVRGSLSELGRAIIDQPNNQSTWERAAQQVLPPVAEEFVAQADLTLVVPGPPSPALRQLLESVADVESTGGAAVYRVTSKSVARGLDSGLSPVDLLAELQTRSATPLPQPLEYMVNDAARRYGDVRVGAATSYLRCDSEQTLAEILSHRSAAGLNVFRLAPTVLGAQESPQVLADLARSAGHAPMATGVDGQDITSTRRRHRTAEHHTEQTPHVDEVFVAALVRALTRSAIPEAADIPLQGAPTQMPRLASAASAQVLRRAHETSTPAWVGYADNAGSTSRRLVDVVAISNGAISAYDHSSARIRTMVLSRITGVQLASDVSPEASRSEDRPDHSMEGSA